jgi:hypothetical protein
MILELTEREIQVIRDALRGAEERHARNDFKVLVLEAQELRSKISDVIISQSSSKVSSYDNHTEGVQNVGR